MTHLATQQATDRPTRVAVVGDGPSGGTLATLLAKKGVDVAVFASGKRPDLVVGESLIPAIIPVFRRLGIEEEVAQIGQLKLGGTFLWKQDCPVDLTFANVRGLLPEYSYNCPRPALDEVISQAARRSGARWIDKQAKLRTGQEREIMLEPETLAEVPDWSGEQPDLIVDATGRRRTIVKMLKIPADEGPRKDVAYFAHYADWMHDAPEGQIIITRMEIGGWNWRIPLRDRMSVGIVLNKETASTLGDTPEERLERAIELDPHLAKAGAKRCRVTGVPTYNNYQLITQRGHGPGWVASGDAFGFVDPMLSPGMWVAMHSGEILADLIPPTPPSPADWEVALSGYEKRMKHLLESWQELIAWFYNGSVMASYFGGYEFMKRRRNWLVNRMEKHVQRNFAGMACGALTERAYSRGLLRFICKYGTYGVEPKSLAVG